MPTFLSPGVYPTEIDLSIVASNIGPLRPIFIGTAKKGPMNTPTYVTSAQQALDTFGEAFPESYLMYSVLGCMEEVNQAYIVRVGVEYEEGLASDLLDICIDTSGAKAYGWGRIPLFTGIDYGRITLREVSTTSPLVFHTAAVENISYNDQDVSATDGATTATLNFSGSGTDLSDAYDGCTDDSWIVVITGDPDDAEAVAGATYEVVRNSDSVVVASGTLTDTGAGVSNAIDIGDGLVFNIEVSAGRLEENDSFTFTARPDNRSFSVSVEGAAAASYTMPSATYSTAATFVAAVNLLLGASEDYLAVEYTNSDGTVVPQLRTREAGRWIQLLTSCQFAGEVGSQQYAYDIPRSNLVGSDSGPYTITTQNNRIVVDVIPETGTTVTLESSLASGSGLVAADVAAMIDVAGANGSDVYFNSFALTIPGGSSHVAVIVDLDHIKSQLKMQASYSNLRTLRLAEELGIASPYTSSYRGFSDSRTTLPATGESDPATPLSCETAPAGDDCASDTAYFANIVGWIVAASPGTWIDGYNVTVSLQTSGAGESAGRYQVTINSAADNSIVEVIQDVSFDKSDAKYIANLINPGTTYGGVSGNEYINWEERPAFLGNDPTDVSSYEIRQPAQVTYAEFSGGANGIPDNPAYSTKLDAAIIGNSYEATGLYAVQNAESFQGNMLLTPGFSSGAVIGQALQLSEARGDLVYLVDPPFGLKPQQVTDWHNGMLTSDVASAINSSYGGLFWSWCKIYDQFSKDYIWVPPSGHVASVFGRTSRIADPWIPAAGTRRGRLNTVTELEYDPGLGDRDLLYGSGNAVNAIVNFPNRGIVVFGNKTLYRTESVLNRLNVRMLVNEVKKGLKNLLLDFVFEPNDSTTWAQVRSVCEPYLADIQARRGLDGYRFVCDETNNTPTRRSRNQLWASCLLVPTPSVEFIALQLVLLSSSASFSSEEVLSAAGVVTR